MAALPATSTSASVLRPLGVAQTSVYGDKDYYVLDAALDVHLGLACVVTSDRRIRVYHAERLSHVQDIVGRHTATITDIVIPEPHIVYTCQEDVGVLISDLRMPEPVRYLTELQRSANGYSISVAANHTLSGGGGGGASDLAVAAGGDIHIVDTRTFQSACFLESVHTEDITRMRYTHPGVMLTGSDDLMLNVVATRVGDSDMLLSSSQFSESLSRITVLPPALGVALAVGACETAVAVPFPAGIDGIVAQIANQTSVPKKQRQSIDVPDFAMEKRFPRPTSKSYVVDWICAGGGSAPETWMLVGEYGDMGEGADDDTAADEAQAADFTAKSRAGAITSALRMQQFDLLTAAFTGSPVTLQAGIHTGVVRCALGAPDGRFVTAGEDGTLAIWRLGDQNDGTDSSRSSASEGKVTAGGAHHAARRRAAAPY